MIWDDQWCLDQREAWGDAKITFMTFIILPACKAGSAPGSKATWAWKYSQRSWQLCFPEQFHTLSIHQMHGSKWAAAQERVIILISPFLPIFVGCYWTRQKKLIHFSEIKEITIRIINIQKRIKEGAFQNADSILFHFTLLIQSRKLIWAVTIKG